MATVPEVRAAIDAANNLIAEAQAALTTTVSAKLAEAKVMIDWIRQTSVDPLGSPQLATAIELCEQQVAPLCSSAIESNTTYRGTL
jgi:hypothetical protein